MKSRIIATLMMAAAMTGCAHSLRLAPTLSPIPFGKQLAERYGREFKETQRSTENSMVEVFSFAHIGFNSGLTDYATALQKAVDAPKKEAANYCQANGGVFTKAGLCLKDSNVLFGITVTSTSAYHCEQLVVINNQHYLDLPLIDTTIIAPKSPVTEGRFIALQDTAVIAANVAMPEKCRTTLMRHAKLATKSSEAQPIEIERDSKLAQAALLKQEAAQKAQQDYESRVATLAIVQQLGQKVCLEGFILSGSVRQPLKVSGTTERVEGGRIQIRVGSIATTDPIVGLVYHDKVTGDPTYKVGDLSWDTALNWKPCQ